MRRLVADRIVLALAVLLAVSLTYAAWQNVSWGYDIWYYHLPFAARLTGIIDSSSYAFSHGNTARYQGFPLFAELLQGIFWRITGKPEAANLVSLFSLFGLVAFLWRMFKVPPGIALFALFAIPLVHIHSTSSYIDLTSNAFATMLLLCVYRVIVGGASTEPKFLVGCALLAAATANSKFQLVPIVVVASLAILIVTLRRAAKLGDRRGLQRRVLIFAIALPVVFFTPIKNTIKYGNPVWPVELGPIAGHRFPFVDRAYSQSPPHLESSPRFVRFARSALEIDNRPIESHGRWTLDQWAPSDDPSCRMGGYFGGYVVVNLLALGFAIYRRRGRRSKEAKGAAIVFGGVTVVAAMVPQSHELRYYMHWMLLLVALNLVLYTAPTPEPKEARRASIEKWVAASVAAIALAIVTWSTKGGYLYASGSTFAEFRSKCIDPTVIGQAGSNERLCIAREPFTFLYAPVFESEGGGRRDHSVQEATSPSLDCQ